MISRRFFNKLLGLGSVAEWIGRTKRDSALRLEPGLTAALPAPEPTNPVPAYCRVSGNILEIGNDRLAVTLDSKTGFLRTIVNKRAQIEHKDSHSGVWPFTVWAGNFSVPDDLVAGITPDTPQRMIYQVNETGKLTMTYSELFDNQTGKPLGATLTVWIEAFPEKDYIAIRATVTNHGPHLLTNLESGQGPLLTGESSPEDEIVMFNFLPGPVRRTEFKGYRNGYPPNVACGWFDYFGRTGGIGFAYVNREGTHTVLEAQPSGRGVSMSFRTLRLKGAYWHNERMQPAWRRENLLYPLKPGESFSTGEWLLIAHTGDWHSTAQVYRDRYNTAFAGDMITTETLHPVCKRALVCVDFGLASLGGWNYLPPVRTVDHQFSEIGPLVREVVDALQVEASYVGVNAGAWARHMGRLPEYFPCAPEAGGQEACKKMVQELRRDIGVNYVMFFTHVAYNHPKARNHVPEADSGVTLNPTNGNNACIDNSAWLAVYRDQIVPVWRDMGINAVNCDEGTDARWLCDREGPTHIHGTEAAQILSQHSRGLSRLQRTIRATLDAAMKTEGCGDITGRWIDIFEWRDPSAQFSMPEHLWVGYGDPYDPVFANHWFVHGLMQEFYPQFEDGRASEVRSKKGDAPRRLIQLRKELMIDKKAPGYPFGFRDSVGLWVEGQDRAVAPSWRVKSYVAGYTPTVERSDWPEGLVAKVFSGEAGITVCYHATVPLETTLIVDCAALGHANLGEKRRSLKLQKGDVGYFVLAQEECAQSGSA